MNDSDSETFDFNELALQTPVRVLFSTILAVLSIPVVPGNAICLVVLFRIQSANISEATQITMISLAIANLGLMACTSLPGIISAAMGVWPFGDVLCSVQAVLFHVTVFANIWSILLMGIDKYLAISRPLLYHQIVSRKKAIVCTMVLWCIAFTGGVLTGPIQSINQHAVYVPYECCCKYIQQPNLFACIVLIVAVIVPQFTIHNINFYTVIIARRQMKRIQVVTPDNPDKDLTIRQNLALKTFILIGTVFDAGILPFVIFYIVDFVIPEKNVAIFYAGFICRVILYTHSLACLYIYYRGNKAFRKELHRILSRYPYKCCHSCMPESDNA